MLDRLNLLDQLNQLNPLDALEPFEMLDPLEIGAEEVVVAKPSAVDGPGPALMGRLGF